MEKFHEFRKTKEQDQRTHAPPLLKTNPLKCLDFSVLTEEGALN